MYYSLFIHRRFTSVYSNQYEALLKHQYVRIHNRGLSSSLQ